jgi:hypothetical protein
VLFGDRPQMLNEIGQAAKKGYDKLTVSVHSELDGTVMICLQNH